MGRSKKEVDPNAAYFAAVAERLRLIAKDHTQAEIARKTETSANNVSRYLRDTKPPIEFCNALVTKMGVNPAWLIAGEGTPYLADATGSTQKTAHDLLALVNAMGAVTKMRLGALAGKQHLQVLRELNDALVRYEELKQTLHDQTRPIFEEMIANIHRLIKDKKYSEAQSLEPAAMQLGRLCEDFDLQRRFDYERVYLAAGSQQYDKSLDIARDVFLREIPANQTWDMYKIDRAFTYVKMLKAATRFEESRCIGRAILALTAGVLGHDKQRWMIEWVTLDTEVDCGLIADSVPRLCELKALLPSDYTASTGIFERAMLLTGAMSVEHVLAMGGGQNLWYCLDAIAHAEWQEEPHTLRLAATALENAPCAQDAKAIKDSYLTRGQCLLRALEGDAGVLDEYAALEPRLAAAAAIRPARRLTFPVHMAHMARLVGEGERAKNLTIEAEKARVSIPPALSPDLLTLAAHHRNVLELFGDNAGDDSQAAMLARARSFFIDMDARGYHCFRAMAQRCAQGVAS